MVLHASVTVDSYAICMYLLFSSFSPVHFDHPMVFMPPKLDIYTERSIRVSRTLNSGT